MVTGQHCPTAVIFNIAQESCLWHQKLGADSDKLMVMCPGAAGIASLSHSHTRLREEETIWVLGHLLNPWHVFSGSYYILKGKKKHAGKWMCDLCDPGCIRCVLLACSWPCCIFPTLCCWEPSTSRHLETRKPPTWLWWTSSARSDTTFFILYFLLPRFSLIKWNMIP